jgi:hypothetical protein
MRHLQLPGTTLQPKADGDTESVFANTRFKQQTENLYGMKHTTR